MKQLSEYEDYPSLGKLIIAPYEGDESYLVGYILLIESFRDLPTETQKKLIGAWISALETYNEALEIFEGYDGTVH